MAWLAALVVIAALGGLALKVGRVEEDWRGPCQGLRERWDRQ